MQICIRYNFSGEVIKMKFMLIIIFLLHTQGCTSVPDKEGKYSETDKKISFGCDAGNCKDGEGTFTYTDGSKYTGQWKDGKKHGQGSMSTIGSRYFPPSIQWKYTGEWKNDKMDGEGTETYLDGRKYVGSWVNGQKSGQGTITTSKYEYSGEWKENKKNGQGTLILPDSSKFVGEFLEDNMTENGVLTAPDGTVSDTRTKIEKKKIKKGGKIEFIGSMLIPEQFDCINFYYGEETDKKFANDYLILLIEMVNQKRRGPKISLKKVKCPRKIQNKKAIGICQIISTIDDEKIDETQKSMDKALEGTVMDSICYNDKCKKECGKGKPNEKYIEKY